MVDELPPQVAKPKPNRALSPHDRGEYIEYASSDQYVSSSSRSRPARYDSSHRHEDACRCIDCRMYWWHVAREHWRHFENRHGQIPPRLDPREHLPSEVERNERSRPAIARRQAVRARRWFQSDLPAWLYCVLAGLPNPRDDAAAEDFDDAPAPTMSAHAEMMEIARVAGVIFRESEGHLAGERDTWGEQRAWEMMRDAEAAQ